MRTTHILAIWLFMCLFFGYPLHAQITSCGPEVAIDTGSYAGTGFFNFGSTAKIKSNTYKTAGVLGQTFIGYTENVNKNSTLGFYARYFLPPFPLKVKATQGDLLDRIQVTWEVDQLGPSASEGFNVFRDGIKIYETSDPSTRNFNDFNVIAGRAYTYCVQGRNIFGEGVCSEAIGFQVPNGVVTGWISTINGTPVPDAEVILTPMQGFSAKFLDGDGAFAFQDTTTNPFLPTLDHDWTIAFWIKTDTTINGRIIGMDSLYIRARPSTRGGIAIAKTAGGTAYLTADFPAGTKHDWHHVALTYDGNGNKHRLYFDGVLVGITTSNPVPPPDTINFGALANVGNGNQIWKGRLDEVRFYNRRLDELDFDMVMDGTASSETPNLTHYWKMDEELGVKSYDIVKRQKLYFCGAIFDVDRPPVHTAGITNEDGYYKIESASYGTGITFLAKPKKNFYMHRSLKFEKSESDYAELPDFPITPKATFEVWVNNAAPSGFQCILSKKFGSNEFRIILAATADGLDNEVRVVLSGTTKVFDTLGTGYQHLVFTWDSTTHTIVGYKNGQLNKSLSFPATAGHWSDPTTPWLLGKRPDNSSYFDGLIDEVAVYSGILTQAIIHDHFIHDRDIQESGLRIYFPLDEGSGNKISNVGSVLLGGGTTFGTDWSPLAAHQVITPHEFAPSTRQVTLNPSVTSVDQVDFTDRSTIGVSGYVRYKNTECFAVNVEILVNGLSFTPKIMTDSAGKFVIDFDPGTSAILTPKFEDHVFLPAFWEITNLSSPIAGILFSDVTTHKITGQVAGGTCKKSIIEAPPGMGQGTICIVKVRSVDGCMERQMVIDNQEGNFEFDNLPPLEKMTVAVVEHSNNVIKTAFQDQGGSTVDLSKRDTVINFIYTGPPIVTVSGLNPILTCPDHPIVLDQFDPVTVHIKLHEQYTVIPNVDDGVCPIDTASFQIINGLADETLDTVMGNGELVYHFKVGNPNPSPPFLKTLQILGTTLDGVEGSSTTQVIVQGIKAKLNTFTTLMPEIPTLILRDPPGDGSYSFLDKDEKFCSNTEVEDEFEGGGGGGLKLLFGSETLMIDAPLGVGIGEDIVNTLDVGFDAELSMKKTSTHSFETCISFNQSIETNDDDLVVGGDSGADLYMGSAYNIVFGNVDIVTFENCVAKDSTAVSVQPGDFATTFIYSEYYILNTLIPNLDTLANDPLATSEDVARYHESIDRWQAILAYNKALKDKAHFKKNISFDAGTEYSYSETSDTATSDAFSHEINSEFNIETEFEFSFEHLGVGGSARFFINTSNGGTEEQGTSKGITTGYVLKDDDPLDAFTFDVGMDSVYKTPVFNLRAGQSSCPWEPGTANREEPNLQLDAGSQFVASNVPANEAAVFKLKLGNLSATNEDWTYDFTSIAEHNPDGAIIKLNGQPLNYLQDYFIPYDSSQTVTITVERGPEAYDYEDLWVAEVSECEYQRDIDLFIPLEEDTQFISIIPLSVHFIRPCSEVNINVPEQNWVLFPDTLGLGADTVMHITISGYDTTSTDFKLIRLQYRRSNGDGAWINIQGDDGIFERYNHHWVDFHTLPPSTPKLGPNFTQFFWNTGELSDGPYEIRAVAICSGDAIDKPGYSQVIKGFIDREPPALVGTPQPSDGVLQQGDEISFTFNQNINCDKLIQATTGHPNNVGLYDETTNKLVDADITCVGNKIVIIPNVQNKYIENHLLRADLHNIKDLTGNNLVETHWEFYVDRNELAWLTDSTGITKYQDETKSITAKIHNRGGYPVAFTLDSIPDWVHVSPDAGTLSAGEILDVTFTAEDTLDLGWFKDSILFRTDPGAFMSGDEPLPFAVRNICRPPDWIVNPALYQMTMTMVTQVKIDGTLSTDTEDQVGAFINGQLRGTAKLIKVQTPTNKWMAFVTIYGNASDSNKTVTLEIFDASACLHYPAEFGSGGTFTFSPNGIQGTSGAPRTLQNTGMLIHEVPILKGWNWISFNLHFPDSTINKVLNNIPNPAGDLIKSNTQFATYNNNTWTGSLGILNNTSMYMYQGVKDNTIKITGTPLVPASVPIPIISGWNWIGYIPTYKLTVNAALASLTPTAGDIIKSQTSFAQYVSAAVGWIGNLKTLQSPNGYLLKMANAGNLTYPLGSFTGDAISHSRNEESLSSFWNVDPSQYEFNMTLTGIFSYDQMNATTADMELGAFVGDELRGVGEAVYIDYLDAYMFFMTCYGNVSGEQIHFKLYDGATGQIQNLAEKMAYAPNDNKGSIDEPVPFTLPTTGINEVSDVHSFDVQPNPFRNETFCRFELPIAQEIYLNITDLEGKEISSVKMQAHEGMNTLTWNGRSRTGSPLSNGVYIMRLKTEQGIMTRKVVLQR